MMFYLLAASFQDLVSVSSTTDLENMKNFQGQNTFRLINNIDFTGHNGYKFMFQGIFDGNGFSFNRINANVTDLSNFSIFGELASCVIKNLTINSPEIHYNVLAISADAIIIGFISSKGSVDLLDVSIVGANLTISNGDTGANIPKLMVGGIIGMQSNLPCKFDNVYAQINVTVDFSPKEYIFDFGYHYFGGLVGSITKEIDANAINLEFQLNQLAPHKSIIGGFGGLISSGELSFILNNSNLEAKVNALELLTAATIIGKSSSLSSQTFQAIQIQNVQAKLTNINKRFLSEQSQFSPLIYRNQGTDFKVSLIKQSVFEIVGFNITDMGITAQTSSENSNYLKAVFKNGNNPFQTYPSTITVETFKLLDFKRSWNILDALSNPKLQAFPRGNGTLYCRGQNFQSSGINSYCLPLKAVKLSGAEVTLGFRSVCNVGYDFISGYCRVSGCFIYNNIKCGDESKCVVDHNLHISFCSQLPEGVDKKQPCTQCQAKQICTNDNGSVSCPFISNKKAAAKNPNCLDNYDGPFCEIPLCSQSSCFNGQVTSCDTCVMRRSETYCFIDSSEDKSFCTDSYCELGLFLPGCRDCSSVATFEPDIKQCKYSLSGSFHVMYDIACASPGLSCAPNAFCDNFLQCKCRDGYIANDTMCVPTNCTYVNNQLCNGSVCTTDTTSSFCQTARAPCSNCHIKDATCHVEKNNLLCSPNVFTCDTGYTGPYCQICESCSPDVSKCDTCMTTDSFQCVNFRDYVGLHMCPPGTLCQKFYDINDACTSCTDTGMMSSGKCVSKTSFIAMIVGSLVGFIVLLILIIVLVIFLVKRHKKNKRPDRNDRTKQGAQGGKSAQDQYSNIVNNWMNANDKAPVKRGQRAKPGDSSNLSGMGTSQTDILSTSRNPRTSHAGPSAVAGSSSAKQRSSSGAGDDIQLSRRRGAPGTETSRQSQGGDSIQLTRGRVAEGNTSTRGRGSETVQTRGRGSDVQTRNRQSTVLNDKSNRASEVAASTRTRGSVNKEGDISLGTGTRGRGARPSVQGTGSGRRE